MKKTMFIIALFAVALVLFTASTTNAIDGRVGHSAPRFQIQSNGETFELGAMKGKWVLIDFWKSTDVTSRINARKYALMEDSLLQAIGNQKFCHVSINMDRYEKLYREIAANDRITVEKQYHAEPNRASKLSEQYHLDSGMKTFLIDPMGYVVAVDPTHETILSLSGN